MAECLWPICNRIAGPSGYCIGHAMYSNSEEVKVKKEIPKESKKEKVLKKDRKKEYERFLSMHPYCMAKFSKDCQKAATVVHHLKGRTPAVVDDQRFWLACCPVCNGEIETRHLDAKEAGLKIPQHHKRDESITIGAANIPHLCGVTPVPDPEPTAGQMLIKEYSKTKAQVKKLRERIEEEPGKYHFISKSGYDEKQIPLDKVAPLFKEFLQITNCSLPQEFIEFLIE